MKKDETIEIKMGGEQTKLALFTDIHFGRKNNSDQHNQDCIDYIKWFLSQCEEQNVDAIMFLGDWNEHRTSINGRTLWYSYHAAKLLVDSGLPVFIIVGNHDLQNTNTRDIFSTKYFEQFDHFHVIDRPTLISDLGKNKDKKIMMFPYLFENEYKDLNSFSDVKVWMGHFEFKGFVVTGENRVMEHGPEHTSFKDVHRIFSGHFHKRQIKDNVVYIGNVFPADYGDANDFKRGMAIYNIDSDDLKFIDWDNCPKYINTNLSKMIKSPQKVLYNGARVKCTIDKDISFQQSKDIKKMFKDKFDLRELELIEEVEDYESEDDDISLSKEDFKNNSTNELVLKLLNEAKLEKLKNGQLVKIYKELGD